MSILFSSIWRWLKKAGSWLKANPWAAIISIAGVYFLIRSKDNKISKLTDAVAVQNARRKIAASEAKAEAVRSFADQKDVDVKEIDKEIVNSKRRVMEISEGRSLKEMSDDEVARMFSDAGF